MLRRSRCFTVWTSRFQTPLHHRPRSTINSYWMSIQWLFSQDDRATKLEPSNCGIASRETSSFNMTTIFKLFDDCHKLCILCQTYEHIISVVDAHWESYSEQGVCRASVAECMDCVSRSQPWGFRGHGTIYRPHSWRHKLLRISHSTLCSFKSNAKFPRCSKFRNSASCSCTVVLRTQAVLVWTEDWHRYRATSVQIWSTWLSNLHYMLLDDQ